MQPHVNCPSNLPTSVCQSKANCSWQASFRDFTAWHPPHALCVAKGPKVRSIHHDWFQLACAKPSKWRDRGVICHELCALVFPSRWHNDAAQFKAETAFFDRPPCGRSHPAGGDESFWTHLTRWPLTHSHSPLTCHISASSNVGTTKGNQ